MRFVYMGIPFSLPFVFKSALPKTAVDDSPGSSLLGLTTTVGAKLLGNAASGNQKTDVCGWAFVLPASYVEGTDLYVRGRAKIATALATTSSKIDFTATLQGDDTVGSDLVATDPQQVTIALANYDFKITGSSLKPGDHLWGTLTLDNNDTGGANNKAMQCTRLWLGMSVKSL